MQDYEDEHPTTANGGDEQSAGSRPADFGDQADTPGQDADGDTVLVEDGG